jgi:hypothetical protein
VEALVILETNTVSSPEDKDCEAEQVEETKIIELFGDIIVHNNNCEELEEDVGMIQKRHMAHIDWSCRFLLNKVVVPEPRKTREPTRSKEPGLEPFTCGCLGIYEILRF